MVKTIAQQMALLQQLFINKAVLSAKDRTYREIDRRVPNSGPPQQSGKHSKCIRFGTGISFSLAGFENATKAVSNHAAASDGQEE